MIFSQNRFPRMKIYLPEGAIPSQQTASAELKKYLDRISGGFFQVTNQLTGPSVIPACKGQGYDEAADFDRLGSDGFTLKTMGENLLIAGGCRGILYGVYELLEKLGCRFFTPACEKIPTLDLVELPPLDETQIPMVEYRDHWFRFYNDHPQFAVKSRINGNYPELDEKLGGHISYAWYVHSFGHILPPEEYYDAHPEYFSLVDGKRLKERAQPCFTNPDVLAITIEKIKKALHENPEATIISVSQNDWQNPCECEHCREIDEREGSHAGSLIHFINQVAEAIEPEFPHVTIDTLAYLHTRPAPKFIRPRHNVCVRLCSIECCLLHPLNGCDDKSRGVKRPDGSISSFANDLTDWSKVCDRLYTWDYITDFAHYCMPFPNWRILQQNIRFLTRHNVRGCFEQGNFSKGDGTDFNELRAYLVSKLLWNPDADVEVLKAEFLEAFYGAAAPFINDYLNAVCDNAEKTHTHSSYNTHCDLPYLTAECLDEYEALFQKAEHAVAGDPLRLWRVGKAHLSIRYVRLKNNTMRGKIDRDAIDKFFDDCFGYGISRVEEWVTLPRSRQAMLEGVWNGMCYLKNWWEEGGEAR